MICVRARCTRIQYQQQRTSYLYHHHQPSLFATKDTKHLCILHRVSESETERQDTEDKWKVRKYDFARIPQICVCVCHVHRWNHLQHYFMVIVVLSLCLRPFHKYAIPKWIVDCIECEQHRQQYYRNCQKKKLKILESICVHTGKHHFELTLISSSAACTCVCFIRLQHIFIHIHLLHGLVHLFFISFWRAANACDIAYVNHNFKLIPRAHTVSWSLSFVGCVFNFFFCFFFLFPMNTWPSLLRPVHTINVIELFSHLHICTSQCMDVCAYAQALHTSISLLCSFISLFGNDYEHGIRGLRCIITCLLSLIVPTKRKRKKTWKKHMNRNIRSPSPFWFVVSWNGIHMFYCSYECVFDCNLFGFFV